MAATGCPTGIAHTFMAEEALKQAAAKLGVEIKVETHGQIGVQTNYRQRTLNKPTGSLSRQTKM
ncbi:hypothetical protein PO124_21280 [Bacillus licheniformis]|nr:hypothetical protein [Bacillus licheniformis]